MQMINALVIIHDTKMILGDPSLPKSLSYDVTQMFFFHVQVSTVGSIASAWYAQCARNAPGMVAAVSAVTTEFLDSTSVNSSSLSHLSLIPVTFCGIGFHFEQSDTNYFIAVQCTQKIIRASFIFKCHVVHAYTYVHGESADISVIF